MPPKPPKDESFKEWLGYMAQIMNRDGEDYVFVVGLLNYALSNDGLTDRQAKWANRLIYPIRTMLETAGLWPPPQSPTEPKPDREHEGNVVFLRKKEE